jgi:hypothetical protein
MDGNEALTKKQPVKSPPMLVAVTVSVNLPHVLSQLVCPRELGSTRRTIEMPTKVNGLHVTLQLISTVEESAIGTSMEATLEVLVVATPSWKGCNGSEIRTIVNSHA